MNWAASVARQLLPARHQHSLTWAVVPAQLVLRHVHLDATADHVGAAFLHDRLPPPPALLQRGAPHAESAGDGSPQSAAGAADNGRKPLSKAERKRQKRVRTGFDPGCCTQGI